VLTFLRELYSGAKRGGEAQIREFAACCKFMGFRNLDKPGYFDQINMAVGAGSGEALFKHAGHIRALRAAYANAAPQEVITSIRSEVEKGGVTIDVDPKGKVMLVFGDKQKIKTEVDDLIEQRNAARSRRDFKEADRLRVVLAEMGITLRDFKDPETGEPKSEIVQ